MSPSASATSAATGSSTRVLVCLGFGLASLVGYVLLDAASARTVAFVLAFAGGAILTMLANTMMPEALHYGGK